MVVSILAKEVQVATPRPSHHFITSSYCAKAIQLTIIYLKKKLFQEQVCWLLSKKGALNKTTLSEGHESVQHIDKVAGINPSKDNLPSG